MTRTVEFFFDCASPYTSPAATQIEAVAARAGGQVQWKPLLIGKVARGAFGAPTFFIGKTQFWGNDRLGLIEEMLAGRLAAA